MSLYYTSEDEKLDAWRQRVIELLEAILTAVGGTEPADKPEAED